MKESFFTSKIRVTAHRGDSINYPENTLEAFRSALEIGVDILETDVHLSSDGVVFIWHDDTLESLNGDTRLVSQLTMEELKALDAGAVYSQDGGRSYPFKDQGYVMATLEEALTTFPEAKFNVDLKDNNPRLVEAYAEVLKRCQAVDRVNTASFYQVNLKYFRKCLPEASSSLGPSEILRNVLLNKFFLSWLIPKGKGKAYQIPEAQKGLKIVTPRFIKSMQKKGYVIQVWTINEREDMKRLLDMGVDGVMTDDPAELVKVVQEIDHKH